MDEDEMTERRIGTAADELTVEAVGRFFQFVKAAGDRVPDPPTCPLCYEPMPNGTPRHFQERHPE